MGTMKKKIPPHNPFKERNLINESIDEIMEILLCTLFKERNFIISHNKYYKSAF